MTQQTVTLNTGDEGNKGPSIEDQYKALVEEGVIADDGDIPGQEAKASTEKDAPAKDSNEERPSWLPAKFKTVEAFLKSHEELEKKLGSGKKEEATVEEAETPKPQASAEERKAAEDATKKAGLDLSAVSQEYLDKGGLTDETYTKLDAAGYPKEMVDIYIEGLTNRLNATSNAAYEVTGGQEAYGEMIDWAIANLTEDEQGAFDRAVNSNNKATVLMAVKGLKATMDAAVKANASEEPAEQISKGGKTPTTTYESLDDYMADLNDPRYDTNETFRRKVMEKLDRSSIM
ncbi:hypothetical protein [Mesorhizobium sp. L2C067A000]|uniref:capsid assembly protein n=1 Tax=Mesorhizobium sp. L2C067A000 TaxID=1287106 RepID=UPI0003CFA50A|nr:hypothetical protein [Mesorhizobium sp. L2C067A000]ESZ33855.1 hypothetical protein X733_13740 [Mesorhizobium sp. L2C067A000]